ncbi:hypothetical protein GCM10011490_27670 [Pseudoclavibacter endophyticus]|nr:hypothetical protein GCM10011490_27670 [Pseudoclavibacter endophyticus]
MVAEHRSDYPSMTADSKAVADQLGIGKETVRRWVVQADVDAGDRPGTSSEESADIRRLKAENRGLREDNEILRRASIFSCLAAGQQAGRGQDRVRRCRHRRHARNSRHPRGA